MLVSHTVAVLACGSDADCPAGSRLAGDRCVPIDAGASDAPADAPEDAGPCSACEAPTPLCREADSTCVACLGDGDCMGATPKCDTDAGECVACLADAECTSPTASRCDTATHTCMPCTTNADCAHLMDLAVCDAGECVECTPATEATDCGANSCDPATNACSEIARDSRRTCESCVSDSDCMDENDRCIDLSFMGTPRGGYCMRLVSAGCVRPFGGPVITATSRSGDPDAMYCGIDQSTVSCEAVRALIQSRTCEMTGMAMECMADGARCETVSGFANRCTYSCGTADQCPTGATCDSGYCGS